MSVNVPAGEIQLNGVQHREQMLIRPKIADLTFWSIQYHILIPLARSGGQLNTDSGHRINTAVMVSARDLNQIMALPLRLDLVNRSPMGLTWGYEGAGPTQLAVAILAFATDDIFALERHAKFRHDVIATYHPDGPFHLDGHSLEAWIAQNS